MNEQARIRVVDLEHGQLFGSLTVLKKLHRYNGAVRYRVGCSCGNSTNVVTVSSLTSGSRTSCTRCTRAKAKWIDNAIANTHVS